MSDGDLVICDLVSANLQQVLAFIELKPSLNLDIFKRSLRWDKLKFYSQFLSVNGELNSFR